MTPSSPWARFFLVIVGTAIAIRIAWWLLVPVLPEIMTIVAVVAIWQLLRWYRDRW